MMQYVSACLIVALPAYQVTMTHLIQWNKRDREMLQPQIDLNEEFDQKTRNWVREIDPKDAERYEHGRLIVAGLATDKCVYWKGEDITLNEAKELVCTKRKEYDRLLAVSPFHRVMVKFGYE